MASPQLRHLFVSLAVAVCAGQGCSGDDLTSTQTGTDAGTTTTGDSTTGAETDGATSTGTSTGSDASTDPDSSTEGDTDAETATATDGGSEGCGADPRGISQSLQVGSETRTFELYLPEDYDSSRAYPLIFGFHGGGGSGAESQAYWGLDQAVGSDAIVVYPDGLPEFEGGDTVWMLDPAGEGFVFFDELLEHLKTELCVDEGRVFATGWSMGGYMTNSLGCYRSDVLRAIASVSGGVSGPKPPARPYPDCEAAIPAMIIHGDKDFVIPLSEGEAMRDILIANNGCEQSPSPVDPSPCVAYDCDTPTRWCEFAGGHEWPDFTPGGVWNFFSSP